MTINEAFSFDEYNMRKFTAQNIPFVLTRRHEFVDARMMFGHEWPYRSTLIRKIDTPNLWQVVELSVEYISEDDSRGNIPECDVDHDAAF